MISMCQTPALKIRKKIIGFYVMLISMEYATQENISGEIYTVGKLTKIKLMYIIS